MHKLTSYYLGLIELIRNNLYNIVSALTDEQEFILAAANFFNESFFRSSQSDLKFLKTSV